MIAIIADIHGNLPAFDAVLSEIDSSGCTGIISLGDVAGYYCMVNECIDLIRSRKITHIMGNHDYYLASGNPCPRSQSANICLDYQRSEITEDNRIWLSELPRKITRLNASMVHGGWNDYLDEYIENIGSDYFSKEKEMYFFSGHTHVQKLIKFDKKTYCNPGSVGQPRDNDPRAAFALFDGSSIELRRVTYDIDSIRHEMRQRGFDDYLSENLYSGTKVSYSRAKGLQ